MASKESCMLPLLVFAVGLITMFILFLSPQDVVQKVAEPAKEAATAVKTTAEEVGDKAKQGLAALGEFFKKKLPNGVELNIPELGVENKLIAFIEDKQSPVDKATWFSFDRLTFDTGKASLKPESQEQLKNIAEILKAYPAVNIKIGGYTDNVGNPQTNLDLSQKRADTVMAEIVSMGVEPVRLQAKGYGEEHPVADNNTEEGQAKNRRIDINVTSK